MAGKHEPERNPDKYVSVINRLQLENARLHSESVRLQAELLRQRGLRNQVRELYYALDSYALKNIDRRGYQRRPKHLRAPAALDLAKLKGASREVLLSAAKEYDAKSFFRYHASKSGMKLRYRLASKLYRTSRDVTKKSAVKGYRLLKRSSA